jgi:hypothetical protein
MARKGDYQIIQMDTEFTIYRWDGQLSSWVYQGKDVATEEEVQRFVTEQGLVLVSEGTLGTWPTRNYRPARGELSTP